MNLAPCRCFWNDFLQPVRTHWLIKQTKICIQGFQRRKSFQTEVVTPFTSSGIKCCLKFWPIRSYRRETPLKGFPPPNGTDDTQTERPVEIGVYLELGHRGLSIPTGGELSSKLEANKVAAHQLVNQQRQINSDKHGGHLCPSQPFMGEENNGVD